MRRSSETTEQCATSSFGPRGIREVLARALVNEDLGFAATRWSDALSSQRGAEGLGRRPIRITPCRLPGGLGGSRPRQAFRPIARIGGNAGWYYGNSLWRLPDYSTSPQVGPGCGAVAVIPRRWRSAMCWTSGEWRDRARQTTETRRRNAPPGTGLGSSSRSRREWAASNSPDASALRIRWESAGFFYWYALWGIHQFVGGECCAA